MGMMFVLPSLPHPQIYAEALTSNVMVFGSEDYEKQFDLDEFMRVEAL